MVEGGILLWFKRFHEKRYDGKIWGIGTAGIIDGI